MNNAALLSASETKPPSIPSKSVSPQHSVSTEQNRSDTSHPQTAAHHSHGLWQLKGCLQADGPVQTVSVNAAVFTVGRRPERHLPLQCNSVSKHHADLVATPNALFVRDLGSTNGTYVNGKLIAEDTPVASGDTIQFAELEFRVSMDAPESHDETRISESPEIGWSLSSFEKLISVPALTPWYQPVIDLSNGTTSGYEVLARSEVQGLETPREMFQTASRLSMDVALSKLCRTIGVATSQGLPKPAAIYLNTHPSENTITDLIPSLTELRSENPSTQIVIELHEAAVTSALEILELRSVLNDLNMKLAYDDFGCGQSRLHELIASPPDVLKFDIALIKDLHVASQPHLRMLQVLVDIVKEAGVIALAEGIECQEEADACVELGFDLAQGYHFGRPAPLAHWNTVT